MSSHIWEANEQQYNQMIFKWFFETWWITTLAKRHICFFDIQILECICSSFNSRKTKGSSLEDIFHNFRINCEPLGTLRIQLIYLANKYNVAPNLQQCLKENSQPEQNQTKYNWKLHWHDTHLWPLYSLLRCSSTNIIHNIAASS